MTEYIRIMSILSSKFNIRQYYYSKDYYISVSKETVNKMISVLLLYNNRTEKQTTSMKRKLDKMIDNFFKK